MLCPDCHLEKIRLVTFYENTVRSFFKLTDSTVDVQSIDVRTVHVIVESEARFPIFDGQIRTNETSGIIEFRWERRFDVDVISKSCSGRVIVIGSSVRARCGAALNGPIEVR